MNGAGAMPPDMVLLMAPDGRFALISRERLLEQAVPVGSVTEILGAMARALTALPWRSEDDTREQLVALGLSAAAVEDQIGAARRKLAIMQSQPTVMERITTPGYRNDEGQEVVRRTEARGGSGQRVFVMRCGVCGHEYGAYGCDIDIRRCPACQDGPAGLPLD